MINIIKDHEEIRKYVDSTRRLFDMYNMVLKYKLDETVYEKDFNDIVRGALETPDYSLDSVRGKVLRENLLGERTLSSIAVETNYSVAHIYFIKQKILKEFAALAFGVILL